MINDFSSCKMFDRVKINNEREIRFLSRSTQKVSDLSQRPLCRLDSSYAVSSADNCE